MSIAGNPGHPARVIKVDPDTNRLWARLSNGQVVWINLDLGPDVEVGSVIIFYDGYEFEIAPEESLIDNSLLGVVRIKDPERTLIEVTGGFAWVTTNPDLAYDEWSTVEFNDRVILKKISDDPIRLHDHRPAADTIHNRFHVPKASLTETFADVAGLDSQIEQLRDWIASLSDTTTGTPTKMRPVRGILFAGESGTGKTLLAKALATEAKAEFFQVRGPEVTSKWVNESEETLRLLFDYAATFPRAIIFLDEIDSIAAARSSTSHEMSNRFVTQLLTLMDGIIDVGNLLVLGATNRPDHLDPTLLRRGRFDWTLEFNLPGSAEREDVLRVSFPHEVADPGGDFRLSELAKRTEGWSGADIVGIWQEAEMFIRSEKRSIMRPEDAMVGLERAQSRSGRGRRNR